MKAESKAGMSISEQVEAWGFPINAGWDEK
jgi:hypothetical protein